MIMRRSIEFDLPFVVDVDGFPTLESIADTGLICHGAILDLGNVECNAISKVFEATGGRIFRVYVYDVDFTNCGRFNVGKESIATQCERFSIFNMIFEDAESEHYFFVSENQQWVIFIGNQDFVDDCRIALNISGSVDFDAVTDPFLYSDAQIAHAREFLSTYSG